MAMEMSLSPVEDAAVAASALLLLAGPDTQPSLTSKPHRRARGDEILNLLSDGAYYSERQIRKELGDSPDTSKALRK